MFSMRLIDVKKKLAGMKKRWYLNDKRTTGKSDPGFGKTTYTQLQKQSYSVTRTVQMLSRRQL